MSFKVLVITATFKAGQRIEVLSNVNAMKPMQKKGKEAPKKKEKHTKIELINLTVAVIKLVELIIGIIKGS